MSIIIVKNTTSSEISIDDLAGQVIGANETFELSDYYTLVEIVQSSDLEAYINDGTIIINDGNKDLNKTQSLKRVTEVTKDQLGLDIYKDGNLFSEQTEILNFKNFNVYDSTAGVAVEYPAVDTYSMCQIRRTSTLEVPTAWVDLTFDITDIETKPEVIEHDDTNTDRILIKETDYYEIEINTIIRNTVNTKTTWYRLRVNDSITIPGSEFDVDLYQNETHELSRSVITQLQSGDFISLQIYTESNDGITTLFGTSTILIKSLSGVKGTNGLDGKDAIDGEDGEPGLPGPAGSGSTITIFEDDLLAAEEISIVNFEGFVDVTQDSTGQVTVEILDQPFEVNEEGMQILDTVNSIDFKGNVDVTQLSSTEVSVDIVFGSEFQKIEDDDVSSTTSTSYQQKLRMTTTDLPSGTYRLGWYYEWQHRAANNDIRARIQIDDTDTLMEQRQEAKDGGSDQWYPASGFLYITESGIHTIDLDYNSSSNGVSTSLRRTRFELWRVS